MSTAGVLAAAAALRRFSAPQLAAYCAEDSATVERVLAAHPGLVEREAGGDWRVRDLAALRERTRHPDAAARGDPARPPRPPRPARPVPGRIAARLLLAEKLLLDCADESDDAARRVMAATAHNHLRKCVAAFAPGTRLWWEVDGTGELTVPELRLDTGTDRITGSRLRLDLALARFTGSEAAGGTVGVEELVSAAGELDGLPAGMAGDRRLALVRRLANLSSRLLRPLAASPPARFLATVAVRRATDGVDGVAAASQPLIQVLNGLASEPAGRDGGGLYRLIEDLPSGRAHLAVYTDLVPLLPAGCEWQRVADPLPGAVVELVADGRARQHLLDSARELESWLDGSPYPGASALIGQAADLLADLAMLRAEEDSTVLDRASASRRSLLSLAGAPV